MSKRIALLVILFSFLLVGLTACTPETVEVTRVVTEVETITQQVEVEIPVEVTRIVTEIETVIEEVVVEGESVPLGSAERPIKVLFVPSVEVDAIISGGEVLADALEEATGLKFVVSVPTSYAATIEEMCASPDDTIGFIPAQGYVLANNRCGVTVGGAAVRRGLSWYAAQYIVPFDSDYETVADLDGKSWCIPDYGSTSGYLYPSVAFQNLGIEPSQVIEAGGHQNAILGVYNGECDFATSFFSPPLLPSGTWRFGVDSPEIWREGGDVELVDGASLVGGGPANGGYRILDARGTMLTTAPDIFEKTRILALTDQIPNDTVSFGPEFPFPIASQIIRALVDFTASEACYQSICAEEFYSWTGIEPVGDPYYDPVRSLMSTLGITEEEVFGGG